MRRLGKRCGKGKEYPYRGHRKVTDYAVSIGFEVAALEFSPIKGPEGNIEYLVHLKKRPEEEARIVESVDIRGTVDAAFDTLAKKDPAEEKK